LLRELSIMGKQYETDVDRALYLHRSNKWHLRTAWERERELEGLLMTMTPEQVDEFNERRKG